MVRTAGLSFNQTARIAQLYKRQRLVEMIGDDHILEALYIASPSLVNILFESSSLSSYKNLDTKTSLAVAKYLLRMSTRPTPFGLFSGVCTGEFAQETAIVLNPNASNRRFRLSFDVLNLLHHQLLGNDAVINQLKYSINTSLYRIGNDYRYIKTEFVKDKKKYVLEHISSSENLVDSIDFFKEYNTIPSYLNFMEELGYDINDVFVFAASLIESQILMPETQPYTCGKPYLPYLIDTLFNVSKNNGEVEFLKNLAETLRSLDDSRANQIEKYQSLEKDLKERLNTHISSPIQVDLFYKTQKAEINKSEKRIIELGYKVLSRISFAKNHERLQDFKRNFLDRYAGNPKPLVEVLDPDCGIGYPINQEHDEYWYLSDMDFGYEERKPAPIPPDAFDELLRFKIDCTPQAKSIELTNEDLNDIPERKIKMPSTFYALTERYVLNGRPIYYMPAIGGATASSLMGRFSGQNEDIDNLLKEISDHEAKIYKNSICADIDHIPENRTGNILFRKNFRNAIIPFMSGKRGSSAEYISLGEIYLDFSKGKLVLTKGINGKRIVPFLSNAHNFKYSPLPIYTFLCDFQYSDIDSELVFQWGNIGKNRVYLPRITHKDIILSKAKWNMSMKIINKFFEDSKNATIKQMNEFREYWNLPSIICLVQGDNLLYLDLTTSLGMDLFLFEIRNLEHFVLEEFIKSEEFLVKNKSGKGHVNQVLFTFKNYL